MANTARWAKTHIPKEHSNVSVRGKLKARDTSGMYIIQLDSLTFDNKKGDIVPSLSPSPGPRVARTRSTSRMRNTSLGGNEADETILVASQSSVPPSPSPLGSSSAPMAPPSVPPSPSPVGSSSSVVQDLASELPSGSFVPTPHTPQTRLAHKRKQADC